MGRSRRPTMVTAVATACLLALGSTRRVGAATVIHMAVNGSDSAPGDSAATAVATLHRALQLAGPNWTVSMEPGVYSATSCGATVTLSHITLASASFLSPAGTPIPALPLSHGSQPLRARASILCPNGSTPHVLAVHADNVSIVGVDFDAGGFARAATVSVTASTFTLTDSEIQRGFVAQEPDTVCPPTCEVVGGGLVITSGASTAGMTINLTRTSIVSNTIVCTSVLCAGGGVYIRVRSASALSSITLTDCNISSNAAESRPINASAGGVHGGGLAISNSGAAPLRIAFNNVTVGGNTAELIGYAGNGTIPLPIIGGGVSVMNVDYASGGGLYSNDLRVAIAGGVFTGNVARSTGCNSVFNDAANSGALAFSGAALSAAGTLFSANGVVCLGTPHAATVTEVRPTGGIAEGGVIFVQGLDTAQPAALQPTLRFTNCTFDGNYANCTGPGCASLGGAIQVTVAANVTLTDCACTRNTVECTGSSCQASGGCLSLQNGPVIIGAAELRSAVTGGVLANNTATAAEGGPEYALPEARDSVAGAFGAGIGVISLFGGADAQWGSSPFNTTTLSVAGARVEGNQVVSGLTTTGYALGAGYGAWVAGGTVNAAFTSTLFAHNAAVCIPSPLQGPPCTSSPESAAVGTVFASLPAFSGTPVAGVANGALVFAGAGCAFVGNVAPENSSFVHVAESCRSRLPPQSPTSAPTPPPSRHTTTQPSVLSTHSPTTSPTATPSQRTSPQPTGSATPTTALPASGHPTPSPSSGQPPSGTPSRGSRPPSAPPTRTPIAPNSFTPTPASSGGRSGTAQSRLSAGDDAGVAIGVLACLGLLGVAGLYIRHSRDQRVTRVETYEDEDGLL
eukprot:m.12690 g.12690  ORF g.12690 m.12690 type:complete len:855 (+) comp4573_c0_seq1:213-2777(+)